HSFLNAETYAYSEAGLLLAEASLVLQGEGERVTEVGSYEDDFNENDDNRAFWDLPNIIAAAPR
ncbi:MAG: hypothetical protein AAF411_25570, partial [Myxococcota bacterium]